MQHTRTWREVTFGEVVLSDLGIVIMLALAKIGFHLLFANEYGFHRDELQFFDDGRYLAWGYITYPPLTPFIAGLARVMFGTSLVGLRLFSILAQAIAMIVAALIAREMGGRRLAQILTSLAVAIAPVSVMTSSMFTYVAFDFLWWVVIAYCTVRLLKTDNPRWWLGIGAGIGLGMLTKYTMAFYVAGIVGGVLLTGARRYLKSRWLWAGVGLSLLIFLPNLIWQIQHDFVSLNFLSAIHARDVAEGEAKNFLSDQLIMSANPFGVPLWIAGLYFVFFGAGGRPYRMLGWMAAIPVAVFWIAQGRGYYTAGVYPILLAAGACFGEKWLDSLSVGRGRAVRVVAGVLLAGGAVIITLIGVPLSPVHSPTWEFAASINEEFKEELGWPELVETVAGIYTDLPADERAQTGIFAGNYGEAGALNLYGPAYGLPEAISGDNTYWLRGYDDPPPHRLIVVGLPAGDVHALFADCTVAGHNTNRYGVQNEESSDYPDIFVCGGPRLPWPEFWGSLLNFG